MLYAYQLKQCNIGELAKNKANYECGNNDYLWINKKMQKEKNCVKAKLKQKINGNCGCLLISLPQLVFLHA